MTPENTTPMNDSSRNDSGVIGTILELGAATTKMTIDQVQNAFTALTNPGAAIDHVKDTLHALSEAMNSSAGGYKASADPTENDLRGASTGREHVGTAESGTTFSTVVAAPYGAAWTYMGKATPRTINRRKT